MEISLVNVRLTVYLFLLARLFDFFSNIFLGYTPPKSFTVLGFDVETFFKKMI